MSKHKTDNQKRLHTEHVYAPRINIVQPYGTHGRNTSHGIEMVQRSAARYIQNDYHYTSSVTNMLRELKWSTLEQRRNQASLTMLHKIHNRQVNVDHNHLTITRNNKFLIPHSKTKHHNHELILSAGYTTFERTAD